MTKNFYERILLMGGPGSGKSTQMLHCISYLQDKGARCHILDCEDKLIATTSGMDGKWPVVHVSVFWEDMLTSMDILVKEAKPEDWVFVDRVDLSWSEVQRWYTAARYKKDLGEKLMAASVAMGTKSSMDMPRFDEGAWQTINENYYFWMQTLLYRLRCNLVLTAGIRVAEDYDVFGHLKVAPRGQKELPHQPHTAILLHQTYDKVEKEKKWLMTTGKDLPGRLYYENEPVLDFAIQYLGGVVGI